MFDELSLGLVDMTSFAAGENVYDLQNPTEKINKVVRGRTGTNIQAIHYS